MIVSGHTHQPYVCDVKDPADNDRLVTSASSFGRLFTETNLQFDRRTQDIVRSSVEGANMIVTRDTKDPAQTALINQYKELVRPIASKVIGTSRRTSSRAAPVPTPGVSRSSATSSPTPSSPTRRSSPAATSRSSPS